MKTSARWMVWSAAAATLALGPWLAPRLRGAPLRAAADAPATPVPSVEVERPERRPMARRLSVPATLEALERTDLYAKATGFVAELKVDLGDRVKAGQLLVALEVPELTRDLEEARARRAAQSASLQAAGAAVDQARQRVEVARGALGARRIERAWREVLHSRQKQLHEEKSVTDQDLEESSSRLGVARAEEGTALAQVASAQAEVRVAESARDAAASQLEVARAQTEKIETMLGYTRIVAPFDGVITRRLVDRGALVQAAAATATRTSPLLTIQNAERMRVSIDVPEVDVPFLRGGDPARVRPHGWDGPGVEGRVARAAGALQTETRTMRAEIDLPNPDGRLLPGMYAQVTLELDRRPDALTIPAQALLTEGGEPFVYTVKDGRAVRTPVKIGLDDGVRLEIVQGVGDQDLVVVTGKSLLSPGALVRTVSQGSGR